MNVFSTIVVGTSLSDTSTSTLCCLQGLRNIGTRKVFLIHAINIRDVGTLYRQLRSLALPLLDRQKRVLEGMGFEVEADVRLGLPFYEIQRVASEQEASLIAVHLTTESLLGTMFVGGVAYEVIQRADRPVLAMKAAVDGDQCEVLCENVLQHILFPTDFSANADRALDSLKKIVAASQSEVSLVHVREPNGDHALHEGVDTEQERLEQLARQLTEAGARSVEIVLRTGSPTSGILELAGQHRHSLIVMGSQGAGFIKEVFLGSVSHNLVRYARIPVLLVPAQRD